MVVKEKKVALELMLSFSLSSEKEDTRGLGKEFLEAEEAETLLEEYFVI